VLNGAGADLAVFEWYAPEAVALTIGGVTISLAPSYTGTTNGAGAPVNVALFDLSDFGFAAGVTIDRLLLGGAGAEPMAVGALNSVTVQVPEPLAAGVLNSVSMEVPEPGSVLLYGIGLAGLGFAARRRRPRA
jgi:hypothetical protein